MSQLSSSFFRALTLASFAFTAACGTQSDESFTPTAQEEGRLLDDGSTEKQPGSGQFCGGFANIACPAGFTCVDDPNDSCDPNTGGADCGGICAEEKKPKCDYNDPAFEYVSRDPNQCAAVTFICEEGKVGFFNECGCGCQTQVCNYNDPNRTYVATSPETCAVIRFTCPEGQTMFSDACGCGCETAPKP